MTEIKKDCTTCRWYAYLTTLDEHLCHHPDSSGHIAESDVYNTGCPGWTPKTQVVADTTTGTATPEQDYTSDGKMSEKEQEFI